MSRPSGKATLAAAAAAAALVGAGAAVWIASSDDGDAPANRGSSVASAVETTESAPGAPSTEESAPTKPPEPEQEAPQPPQEAGETTPAEKTRFPRERRKPQNDPPRREFSIPPAREFSGNGNATLGTVNLRQPVVVRWSTKGRFELRFGREDFPIIAPSPSGQLIVPPYSFERVRVIARGRWKISITPQS
jgi:hypothetical protein